MSGASARQARLSGQQDVQHEQTTGDTSMDERRTDLAAEEVDIAAQEMLKAMGWPDFEPSWRWSEFSAEENQRIKRGMERVDRCMRTYGGEYNPDVCLRVPGDGWTHLARAWLTSEGIDEYADDQLKAWFRGVMAATRTDWEVLLDGDPSLDVPEYPDWYYDDLGVDPEAIFQEYLQELEEDEAERRRCESQNISEPLSGSLADWARKYAGRGWPVYPVASTGKPLVDSALQRVGSTDVTLITAWWDEWPDAHIALSTGAATGWVAAEVRTSEALRAVLMLLPPRRFVVTRLNGSRLILFRVHTAAGWKSSHWWDVPMPGTPLATDWIPSQRWDDPTTGMPLVIMHGDGDVVLLPPSRVARNNGR